MWSFVTLGKVREGKSDHESKARSLIDGIIEKMCKNHDKIFLSFSIKEIT